jgi:hypothetical protein
MQEVALFGDKRGYCGSLSDALYLMRTTKYAPFISGKFVGLERPYMSVQSTLDLQWLCDGTF